MIRCNQWCILFLYRCALLCFIAAFFKSVPLFEKLSFCSDCMLDDVDMKTHWRRTYCDLAKIACFEGICAGFATFSSLTGQSGRWEHCSNIMRNYCTLIALIKIKFYLWIRMQRIAKAFQQHCAFKEFLDPRIPNPKWVKDHWNGPQMIPLTAPDWFE